MAGSTYDAVQQKKNSLIRKARNGSVFATSDTSATTAITTLTDSADSGLSPLPVGYTDVGWLTEDGFQFARNIETSDTTSFGANEPTRSDTDSDVTTLQIVMQETKAQTIGMYIGVDTSTVTGAVGSAEVSIAKPATPADIRYRVLAIAVDKSADGEIYIARFLPNAKITERGDQQIQRGEDAIGYDVTFQGYMDSALGYSERYLFGGPGWKAILTDMGFTQAV